MCEIGVMFIKKYIVMKKIFISMMLSSLLLGVMSCTYENDNYEGKVLLCLCSPQGTHFDHRLGNIGWNDKITALRVLISDANSSTDRKYYNINLDEHSHGSLADGWLGTLGYPAITPYTAH